MEIVDAFADFAEFAAPRRRWSITPPKPGCYAFLGNGDGSHRLSDHGAGPCIIHNTSFDFNDAIIPIGASYFVRLAERWLAQPS